MSSDKLFDDYGKVLPEGQTIFHEKEEGEEMYLIRKGRVRITKTFHKEGDPLGLEKELVILEKGDFFGEMSLLNQEPRAATAEVLEEVEVLVINRPTFENMIKTNGHFALKIISKLCERVKNTDKLLDEFFQQHKQKKIIHHIIELETKFSQEIPMTELKKLANENSNLSEEDIDNILNKLSKNKIIEGAETGIKVVDSVLLKNLNQFLEI